MTVTIITKNSSAAGAVPNSSQLVRGELAVNVTDKKLYTLDASNNIILLSSGEITLTTSGTGGAATLVSNVLNIPQYGSGTVTNASVVTANGFAGTVATSTSTPSITLRTTVTGILKGNGTSISNASPTTDYQIPITLTTLNTSGGATFISGTLNIPQYQGAVSLTTTGTSGAATFAANTLNIPQYQGVITLTTTGTSGATTLVGNTLNVPQYQGVVSLTTTGTTGAATFSANTLNIPQYQGAITLTSTGTTGAATLVGNTLNIPTYSTYSAATPTVLGAVYGVATASNTGVGNNVSIGGAATTAVAIGTTATVATSTAGGVAVGSSSNVTGSSGIAIGSGASAVIQGTAVGATATVQSSGGVAIGYSADVLTSSSNSISIGNGSSVNASQALAIGVSSSIGTLSTNSIAIGVSANVGNSITNAISIGNLATSGGSSVAIGYTASALGTNAISIGSTSTNGFADGIAIGRNLTVSNTRSILIGSNISDASATSAAIGINTGSTTLSIPNNGLFISGIRATNGSTINGVGSLQTYSTGTGNTKEIFTTQDAFTAYGVNFQKQLTPTLISSATGTVDVTANQLSTCMIAVTGSTGTVSLKMPLGSDLDALFPLITTVGLTNISFDVSIINSSATYQVFILPNTGMTASYGTTVIAVSQSAVFRFRRGGTSSWTYNRISS